MASSLNRAPTAITIDVEDLADRAWGGAIRVPHFQRDFRWGFEDVRRLFDSIVKGYPIGSLLLWQRFAPEAKLRLGALTIDAPAAERAYWVVDGQQRLTSLANALSQSGGSDPRFALAYDLRKDEFVRPPSAHEPHVIPLPVLFDLQALLRWFAANPGIADSLEKATRITKTLRQYEVPAYLVESDDPAILQDIFDRMNNFGKRLTRAEIFTALNAGAEDDEAKATLDAIAASIDLDLGFGTVDDDTVLAAVLARRNPQVKRDIRREFEAPGDEGLAAAYAATESAIRLAIEFLQGVAGVPHYSFLAYKYLLVVLTRFFAHHPQIDSRNTRLLRRWYWQAAVVGPEQFKGGTPNAARILCGKISESDASASIQRLLAAVQSPGPRRPDIQRFSSKDASSKMLLCALWARTPRDPITGDPYTLGDISRVLDGSSTAQPAIQTVVPRSNVPLEYRGWAANRVLMASEAFDSSELDQILSAQSLYLDEESWSNMLASHIISDKSSGLLGEAKFGEFLKERQTDLESYLGRFLAEVCEWEFEPTAPLSTFDLDGDDDDDEGGIDEELMTEADVD